ncbi:NERD domain-containing protein [Rossellomorea aquimaris]|uniref:nuclease-related domain-containing protein n=1 Tax=Rossellomorea aquimaris TaxID=189382 RepID=UPI001CD6AE0D|nr:nuclease-related domain-containing protein [Rossellomorea aquimaris]MCA1056446.1 NERD domain-containing protein [Rossellomorea aquimaris]
MKIEQTEALLRNIVQTHSKIPLLQQDLKKRLAGFSGEKAIDYHLSFLSEKKYLIFNDLRLPLPPYHFQIDSLLVTAYYCLILEIKNISGTLTIDPKFNQLTKYYDGVETGFPDPISQAQRQKLLLQRFFYDNNLTMPPIIFFVVVSNPKTILKVAKGQTLSSPYSKMIHAQNLIDEISKLNHIYTKEVASKKDISKIKRVLLNSHEPGYTNILDQYGIDESDTIQGIRCERCSGKMERQCRTWGCSQCHFTSKLAHQQTIEDYFLLIKPSITNKELRTLLDIQSPKTARNLLSSLNLKTTGTTRATIYHKEFH